MKNILFFLFLIGSLSLSAQSLTIQKPCEPVLKIRSNCPQTIIAENAEIYVAKDCIEVTALQADLSIQTFTFFGSFTAETIFEDMTQQVFVRFFSNRVEMRNFQGKRIHTFYPKYYTQVD